MLDAAATPLTSSSTNSPNADRNCIGVVTQPMQLRLVNVDCKYMHDPGNQ